MQSKILRGSCVLVKNQMMGRSFPNEDWEDKESVSEAILLIQKLVRVWPTWEITRIEKSYG